MTLDRRSGCPINLSLEVFGDRWSLIILRDMIFGGRRHFRELLNHSMEGIAGHRHAETRRHHGARQIARCLSGGRRGAGAQGFLNSTSRLQRIKRKKQFQADGGLPSKSPKLKIPAGSAIVVPRAQETPS